MNEQQVHSLVVGNRNFLRQLQANYPSLSLDSELLTHIDEVVIEVDDKMASDDMHIALVGGFSSGKTTLINALLGAELLESRASPTTICPTFISYGENTVVDIDIKTDLDEGPLISTAMPERVHLRSSLLPAGIAEMTSEDGGVYVLRDVEFNTASRGRMFVDFDTQRAVARTEVLVPHRSKVSFYYDLLTNRISSSVVTELMPWERMPICVVQTSPHQEVRVALRQTFKERLFEAEVPLMAGKNSLSVIFDRDWYAECYPHRYKYSPPVSLLDRIRAFLNPFRAVSPVKGGIPRYGPVTVSTHAPTQVLACFDLDTGALTFRYDYSGFKRRLTLDGEIKGERLRALRGVLSTLTSAGRPSSGHSDFRGIVSGVNIRHPSELLKHFPTIIDTPGIAADSEHTTQTLDIISKQADACLFLCPADQAGTLTDLEFVRSNLLDQAGEIVFLINKIDKADDPDEVQELIGVIREKISDTLALDKPRVYAVSAKRAISDGNDATFVQFTRNLSDYTTHNRRLIMIRRLSAVQATLMSRIREEANRRKQELELRLKELQAYVIEDLRSFISRETTATEGHYSELFDPPLTTHNSQMRALGIIKTRINELQSRITRAATAQEVQTICKEEFEKQMRSMQADLAKELTSIYQDVGAQAAQAARTCLDRFVSDFEAKYSLRRFQHTIKDTGAYKLQNVEVATSNGALEIIAVNAVQNPTIGTAGSIAGGVIGTMVLPVIGTIVGIALGSLLGMFFAPPLEQVKAQAKTAIGECINRAYHEDVAPIVKSIVEEEYVRVKQEISTTVSNYLIQYEARVNELIAAHEAHKRQVKEQLDSMEALASDLGHRINNLDAARNHILRSLQKYA